MTHDFVLVGMLWIAAVASGCSSKTSEANGGDRGAGGGSGGSGDGGGVGGASLQFAGGQAGAGTGTGTRAQDTPDGLQSISADQAAALQDPAAVCAGWAAQPEGGQPPILEFVIDVSGSMADLPAYPNDPTNTATRWQETQRVLPGVFDGLPGTWAVGVSYFRKPDNGCFVPDQSVPIGVMDAAQKGLISASIQARGPKPNTTDADDVQGATPTLSAWRFGLSQLTQWTAPAEYATSPRYIVVITDGVPTVNSDGCTYVNPITQAEYDQEVEIVRTEGQAAAVKTFIVGVLGSEQTQNATYDPRYMLSQLALAGGTEQPPGCTPTSGTVDATVSPSVVTAAGQYCHYDLSASTDFGGSLVSALLSIANTVVSCDYTVPTPPAGQTVEASRTNLIYDDGSGNSFLVLPNDSANCDRGWHFTDSTNTHIQVCDITCNLIQENASASVSVLFGCAAGSIPVK